jgi:iron complex transport system ATP-binding protein
VSDTLVELSDVGFRYPASAAGRPFALRGLSLAIAAGEIVGVIGPNSAGKTTLIRLLTRVLAPTEGRVRLEGVPLASWPRWRLAQRIAVVPQELPPAMPFTVAELVLMGRYPHDPRRFFETAADRAIAREAMEATGVLPLAGQALGALSGGERQRAVLARALAQRPRLLVLDEPTAHLDLRHQVECVGLLRRLNRDEGLTIVLVSHDLNLAADVSDRLLLLAEGRPVRIGVPADVLDEPLLASVYGCGVVVDKNPATGRPLVHVVYPDPPPKGGESTAVELGS